MAKNNNLTDVTDLDLDVFLSLAAYDPEEAIEYAEETAEESWRYANSPTPAPTHDGIDSEGLAIVDY